MGHAGYKVLEVWGSLSPRTINFSYLVGLDAVVQLSPHSSFAVHTFLSKKGNDDNCRPYEDESTQRKGAACETIHILTLGGHGQHT